MTALSRTAARNSCSDALCGLTDAGQSEESNRPLLSGLSVVVPVYNSQSSLGELVARLAAVLPACAEHYEVILVNDGSRDRSWDVICELIAKHPWVRGIDLMRNYGQHNALLCGMLRRGTTRP